MSADARRASSGRKTTPASSRESGGVKPKPRGSRELRRAAEQDRSRAEALEAIYRPLREATESELQSTKSGRKLLGEAHALGTELGELLKGGNSGRAPRDEARLLARECLEQFHKRHGAQLAEAQGKCVDLQPSVEAVVQVLRPERAAAFTTWVAETSLRRSMLLQPKRTPDDVAVLRQGLGGSLPPVVQACVKPPYEQSDNSLIPPFDNTMTDLCMSQADAKGGVAFIASGCFAGLFNGVDVSLASAFVGHDFAVPSGPTKYEATISYDWEAHGYGMCYGLVIVNVDLGIVIDKRDGTRETHAREVSLFTVPFAGIDDFHHYTDDARISIPFSRDGSDGTVRIMVGADGHCVAITFFFGAIANFKAKATVRELCLTSVS